MCMSCHFVHVPITVLIVFVGIFVNGPYAIITTAVSADLVSVACILGVYSLVDWMSVHSTHTLYLYQNIKHIHTYIQYYTYNACSITVCKKLL